jgi:hypothetical protein
VPFKPNIGFDEDAGRLACAVAQPFGQFGTDECPDLIPEGEVRV